MCARFQAADTKVWRVERIRVVSRLTAPPVDVAAAASTRCIALISDEIDCMSVGTSAPTLGAKCVSTAASRSVVQFQRGTIATWVRPEAHELKPMGRDAPAQPIRLYAINFFSFSLLFR